MWRNYLWLLFLLILPLYYFSTSHAEINKNEKILNFGSTMMINPDASIDVIETIFVHANQAKLHRGIVRHLPLEYKDSAGTKHQINYKIQQVLLNNEPIPYYLLQSKKQLAIYISDKENNSAFENYTYVIQYHVTNALHYLKNADEFVWNVTGDQWDLPILYAQVDIHLPDGTTIIKHKGKISSFGRKEPNLIVTQVRPNQITYSTASSLQPHQGLTIGIVWPNFGLVR